MRYLSALAVLLASAVHGARHALFGHKPMTRSAVPTGSAFAEEVGYWFFRLNGCLTTTNFVLHSGVRGNQETDCDIVALRPPHRQEMKHLDKTLIDHELFAPPDGDRTDLVFAEVKTGLIALNRSWLDPNKQVINHILEAVGVVELGCIPEAAAALYAGQVYRNDHLRLRQFAIGHTVNRDLSPAVVQLIWSDVLRFIYNRFSMYGRLKSANAQWDSCGQYLFYQATRGRPFEKFLRDSLAQMSSGPSTGERAA